MQLSKCEDIRSTNVGVPAPEQDGQKYHEEGMGPEIRGVGEVRIKCRRAYFLLHEGEVRGLPSYYGDQSLSQRVAP
jgi:hypothetical protein